MDKNKQMKISSFFTKQFPKLQLKRNIENVNQIDLSLDDDDDSIIPGTPERTPEFKPSGKISIRPLHELQGRNNINSKRKLCITTDNNSDCSTKENEENTLKKVKLTTNIQPLRLNNVKKSLEPIKDVQEINPEVITSDIDPDECPFIDDLDPDDFYADTTDNTLDLTQSQRCKVTYIGTNQSQNIIVVKSIHDEKFGTCILEDTWRDAPVKMGNMVSIKAVKIDNEFWITGTEGFLIIWPDNLITGTEVVGSLYCMRKSILQRNFKGIEKENKIMILGTLIHELFEFCLQDKIYDIKKITERSISLMLRSENVIIMHNAGMSYDTTTMEFKKVIPFIAEFIKSYVVFPEMRQSKNQYEWKGQINEITDIEESIWSPRLGLSGRIDATVKVTIQKNNKKHVTLMPLELKTGKATASVEHRGQVMLYTMLMSEIETDRGRSEIDSGLLLYIRDAVNIQQITTNHNEKKSLLMLRNQLAVFINDWLAYPQQSNEIEGKCSDSDIILPEPINRHNVCSTCPNLTVCTLYFNKSLNTDLANDHVLVKLKDTAIGHLKQSEIDYFFKWCRLIKIEDRENLNTILKEDIWTMQPLEREKRGKCLTNMILISAKSEYAVEDGYYLHEFHREHNADKIIEDFTQSQLQNGGYVIISSHKKYGTASGLIESIDKNLITIKLNRKLNLKTLYSIDSYDSNSSTVFNFTNLGILMDNSEMSNKIRKIVVDRVRSSEQEIPKTINGKGEIIFSQLNKAQKKVILRAFAVDDYLLVRGMPGTGKTQTLSTLVQLLVNRRKKVLITSHTHSAVDTLLSRLANSDSCFGIKMLRLGSIHRIHPSLHMYAEDEILESVKTAKSYDNILRTIFVYGVTCLGLNHPIVKNTLFDYCIMDESTQALQCTALRAIFSAKKFILVGDPDQLPPIVKSAKAKSLGMDESLFKRLDGLGSTVSLNIQYRMNKIIMGLANSLTYNNQLLCASDEIANSKIEKFHFKSNNSSWLNLCLNSSINNSVVVIDTGNTYVRCRESSLNNSDKDSNLKYSNICEVALTLHIAKTLMQSWDPDRHVGIIAPYREQVNLLQKSLNHLIKEHFPNYIDDYELARIEINTVDQYQGRDKDIIIYSCTKTWNTENIPQIITDNQILEDKRRLTVAITRAKKKLIIIGDVASMRLYKPFEHLFDIITNDKIMKKAYISLAEIDNDFSWEKTMAIFNA